MKKKGTVGKIRLSSVATLFIVTAGLATALRIYQFFGNVLNAENGALEWDSLTVIPLYAIAAIAAILLLILPFLSANMPKSVLPQKQSKKLGFAGFVLTCGLILDVAIQTGKIIAAQDAFAGGFRTFLKETGLLPNILQVFFGLFAALYALLFSISYFKGKNVFTNSKILALTPVGWAVCRMISRFMRETSFLKNTELFFELAMICFVIVFFFAFARIASQLENKGKMWALFGCGFPAALFSLFCSVPRLAVMFAGYEDMLLVKDSPLEYVDLAIAVFILILLFTLINEYQAGNYEYYDEENADFDFTKQDDSILAPIGEVVPDSFIKTRVPAPPAQKPAPLPGEDDEAFEIASQYSNRYMQTTSPYEYDPEQQGEAEEAPQEDE